MPLPPGYHEQRVSPKASRGVEALWTFTAEHAGRSVVLPDGRCDVILRDSLRSEAPAVVIVTGPATRPYIVSFEVGDRWRGVRLRPGGGAAVWAAALPEAVDVARRGPAALALIPELGEGPASLSRLTEALAHRLSAPPDPVVTRAVDVLHAAGGRVRVARLAPMIGCTARHLNRVFRSQIGLPVKTYASLVQFHRTLRLIEQEGLSLPDAAAEGGYADQPHLSRAFRRFGGFAPGRRPEGLTLPGLFS